MPPDTCLGPHASIEINQVNALVYGIDFKSLSCELQIKIGFTA